MDTDYHISITLDKRRPNKKGLFHVRIRVYHSRTNRQKLLKTPYSLSEKEFDIVWNNSNRRKRSTLQQDIYVNLTGFERKAIKVASQLKPFDLDLLEKKLYTKTSDRDNVLFHYKNIIEEKENTGAIKTSETYANSRNSILEFQEYLLNKDNQKLSFYDITPKWLNQYEDYMIKTKGKSHSTVGIYLRVLRAIFNSAIKQQDIHEDYYPFGKGKYQVPQSKGVKKSLTGSQLKILKESKPLTEYQEKAKDFWFLSFACNGINIKDLAKLEKKHIQGNNIVIHSTKNEKSNKSNLRPINIILTPLSKELLKKYADYNKKYILGIIEEEDSEFTKQRKVDNFNRYVNQHIKKIATNNGLPGEISTYWARHTFATTAINQGAPMEFVGEALAHNNLKTTQAYFSGFEDQAKRDIMNKLTDI